MADRRSVRTEDICQVKIATAISVGPGLRLAYSLKVPDMEESLYRTQIWSVVPGQEPAQMTRGEQSCTHPDWSPSGRFLAFLSARSDGKQAGDEPKAQIWLLPTAGGEPFCLTKAPHGVHRYVWAPNGESLYFVGLEPELDGEKVRKARDKKRKIDPTVMHGDRRRRQIWQVEAKCGAEERLLFEGDLGLHELVVSPDGRELAYTTNETGLADDYRKMDIWTFNLETRQTRRLTEGMGGCQEIAWRPDGGAISFVAPHDPRYITSRAELFVVPSAGGKVDAPFERNAAFYGDVQGAVWQDSEHLLLSVLEGCYIRIYRMNVDTAEVTLITPPDLVCQGMALSLDRRYLAYMEEGSDRLPDVVLFDLQRSEAPTRLTDLNPAFRAEIALCAQQVIQWPSTDGLTIEGILTMPPGHQEGERPPLLVYVHGGPHYSSLNTLRQYVNFQLLAAHGYAVLAPNYRGGMGYGHAFAVSNYRDLGGGDFRDIMAGVDHLIATGMVDGERMGVLGGSYGGYMTNWAISQTDRFRAAVSMFGMFSLVTDYSQSEMPMFEVNYLGGYWWEQAEVYARCSPSTHVTKINTPVLILHGAADTNTNPANSMEMYQALRHLGKQVQYVCYPREGHGVLEPNHKLDEYRRILEWLDRHIVGRSTEVEGEARQDGHHLRIAAANRVSSYSGRKPKGRFVEITLRVTPGKAPLKLDLSYVRLRGEQGELAWEAGVAGVAAGLLLVPAGGVVEVGAPAALTLVFDIPTDLLAKESVTWRLLLEEFPPISTALSQQGA